MLVQSLINVIESSVIAPTDKRFAGNVVDFDELMTNENLAKLESFYEGVFAFIAFHPAADKPVADYVELGSLGADAGDFVFALFTLCKLAHRPSFVGRDAFKNWLTIEEGTNPSYQVVRSLFPKSPPTLPGILFIEKFSKPTEPVFVSLAGCASAADVLSTARKVFEMAASSYLATKGEALSRFPFQLSVKLAKEGIDYKRGGEESMKEWLVKAFKLVRKHSGDIVSVVKLFK